MKRTRERDILDIMELTTVIIIAIMGLAAIIASIWAEKPHAGFEGAAMLLFAYIYAKGEKGGSHADE